MEKVVIPPFSILYGRGDLTHAGPGFDDFDSPSALHSMFAFATICTFVEKTCR